MRLRASARRGTLRSCESCHRETVLRTGGFASSRRRSATQVRRSVAALRAVPLFDGFSKRHLHRLAAEAEVVAFDADRAIVEEGGAGEAMFVVLSGGARVTRGGRKVATLVPGDSSESCRRWTAARGPRRSSPRRRWSSCGCSGTRCVG